MTTDINPNTNESRYLFIREHCYKMLFFYLGKHAELQTPSAGYYPPDFDSAVDRLIEDFRISTGVTK